MRRFIIYLLFFNLLSACDAAREGFTLKKNETDEFLVEKKSPLAMPPSYNDLPEPKDFELTTDEKKEDEIVKIINNSKNSQSKTEVKKTTSIEQSVIEKIK